MAREGLSEEVMFNQGFGGSEIAGNADSNALCGKKHGVRPEFKTYNWHSSTYLTWDKLLNPSVPQIPSL